MTLASYVRASRAWHHSGIPYNLPSIRRPHATGGRCTRGPPAQTTRRRAPPTARCRWTSNCSSPPASRRAAASPAVASSRQRSSARAAARSGRTSGELMPRRPAGDPRRAAQGEVCCSAVSGASTTRRSACCPRREPSRRRRWRTASLPPPSVSRHELWPLRTRSNNLLVLPHLPRRFGASYESRAVRAAVGCRSWIRSPRRRADELWATACGLRRPPAPPSPRPAAPPPPSTAADPSFLRRRRAPLRHRRAVAFASCPQQLGEAVRASAPPTSRLPELAVRPHAARGRVSLRAHRPARRDGPSQSAARRAAGGASSREVAAQPDDHDGRACSAEQCREPRRSTPKTSICRRRRRRRPPTVECASSSRIARARLDANGCHASAGAALQGRPPSTRGLDVRRRCRRRRCSSASVGDTAFRAEHLERCLRQLPSPSPPRPWVRR